MTASLRIIAILLFTLTLFSSGVEAKNTKYKNVNTAAFKRQIAKTQIVLIDLRTPEEYETEHLENAKMIDFKSEDFEEEITKLPKDIPLCIYCRSGHRSGETMKILKKEGFIKVYNLKGGINAWREKGLKTIQ